MRKQIAAANWKMNLTYQQGEALLDEILKEGITLEENQQVIFAVPFPYLIMAKSEVAEEQGFEVAAQNCSDKDSGAYTGEISAQMLQSLNIKYCIVGHSERREYYGETAEVLAGKVDKCLANRITPIFCCGEALEVRELGNQNNFVQEQIAESLFHLSAEQVLELVIAYEPIWAIGTGKTASTEQAQEMHAFIRSVFADKWGTEISQKIPILYGGSVKAGNAAELFANPDVDGGLVGGASLIASEFTAIIKALKNKSNTDI
jgi:triosephosphate isomerase